MSNPPASCTRCGLPIVGPELLVMLECLELPPKHPEMSLCTPCAESFHRWLTKRQRTAPVSEPVRSEADLRPRRSRRRGRGTADLAGRGPAMDAFDTPRNRAVLRSRSSDSGSTAAPGRAESSRRLDAKERRLMMRTWITSVLPWLLGGMMLMILAGAWLAIFSSGGVSVRGPRR